jgi:predicted nucleic acid-binding protein
VTDAAFFDTNVPLYLLGGDEKKAGRAEQLMALGGTISVQVLNEFAAVARRKYATPWAEVGEVLAALRQVCRVEPLSVAVHERAMALARRHAFPIFDALIAASAIEAKCSTLYSEDFQHGRLLDGLKIVNPFR